jgi:segregation and condensation protein A
MSYLVRTPIFEGPIAVLYEMIEARKLSISEFSLVSITDDFLKFVRSLDKNEKQEVAHFIATAAVLILLKSKSLLPEDILSDEEDRSTDLLENQLKAYGLIKNSLKDLKEIFGKSPLVFPKTKKPQQDIVFLPDVNMSAEQFSGYLQTRLSELEPEIKSLKEVKIDKKIKIEDALNHVRLVIKKLRSINFSKIGQIDDIGDARLKEKSKKTVVILFLSLLELVKLGEIDVVQTDIFGDMLITETTYGESA